MRVRNGVFEGMKFRRVIYKDPVKLLNLLVAHKADGWRGHLMAMPSGKEFYILMWK